MKNDKEIFKVVEVIKQKSSEYVGICHTSNPMAYTDRLIEEILSKAAELKILYDQNDSGDKSSIPSSKSSSSKTGKIRNKHRTL